MRRITPLIMISALLLLGAGCAGTTPVAPTSIVPEPSVEIPVDPTAEITPDAAVDAIVDDVLKGSDSEEMVDSESFDGEDAAAAEIGNNAYDYE